MVIALEENLVNILVMMVRLIMVLFIQVKGLEDMIRHVVFAKMEEEESEELKSRMSRQELVHCDDLFIIIIE